MGNNSARYGTAKTAMSPNESPILTGKRESPPPIHAFAAEPGRLKPLAIQRAANAVPRRSPIVHARGLVHQRASNTFCRSREASQAAHFTVVRARPSPRAAKRRIDQTAKADTAIYAAEWMG